MANPEHVEILRQGIEVWNAWREATWREVNRSVIPDLSEADFSGVNLNRANLTQANLNRAILTEAKLSEAYLIRANLTEARLHGAHLNGARLWRAFLSEAELSGANFTEARLHGANLSRADLRGAVLSRARLSGANLSRADLSEANLSRADMKMANLTCASLFSADLVDANLDDCHVYGVNAWGSWIINTSQFNLIVTSEHEPKIVLDNLALAQFIYLLLKHIEIRNVIDTITAKAVLILGRFTEERKAVLDALRDELRQRGYLPILFDFEKPGSRDLTETISTLAHMARFIIADITDAKSIPQELQAIVPNLPLVAVQPLVLRSAYEYALFEHFKRYPWVLATYQYEDTAQLLESLAEQVIEPAEAKVRELRPGV